MSPVLRTFLDALLSLEETHWLTSLIEGFFLKEQKQGRPRGLWPLRDIWSFSILISSIFCRQSVSLVRWLELNRSVKQSLPRGTSRVAPCTTEWWWSIPTVISAAVIVVMLIGIIIAMMVVMTVPTVIIPWRRMAGILILESSCENKLHFFPHETQINNFSF